MNHRVVLILALFTSITPSFASAQASQNWPGASCVGEPDEAWSYSAAAWGNDSTSADLVAMCPLMRSTTAADTYCWSARVYDGHSTEDVSCRALIRGTSSFTAGTSVSSTGVTRNTATLQEDEAISGSDQLAVSCTMPNGQWYLVQNYYSLVYQYSAYDSSCI